MIQAVACSPFQRLVGTGNGGGGGGGGGGGTLLSLLQPFVLHVTEDKAKQLLEIVQVGMRKQRGSEVGGQGFQGAVFVPGRK